MLISVPRLFLVRQKQEERVGRAGGQVMSRLRALNCLSEEQEGNSWERTELTPASRLKLELGSESGENVLETIRLVCVGSLHVLLVLFQLFIFSYLKDFIK